MFVSMIKTMKRYFYPRDPVKILPRTVDPSLYQNDFIVDERGYILLYREALLGPPSMIQSTISQGWTNIPTKTGEKRQGEADLIIDSHIFEKLNLSRSDIDKMLVEFLGNVYMIADEYNVPTKGVRYFKLKRRMGKGLN